MTTWRCVGATLALFLVAVALGCRADGDGAARITMQRRQHEVRPTGFQPRVGSDGQPQLALDVLVLNRGSKVLPSLTLLVVVIGADAQDRAAKRVTLDTSSLVPGVSAQMSAVVEGIDVKEGETVTVELEADPPESERSQFPEYSHGVS